MEKIKSNVLQLMSENARYSYKQMADILGETEENVKNAVTQLEEEGVIVKYSAIINTEAVNKKTVQAFIEVKVAPQKLSGFDACAEEIYNFPEVKSLYLMSGGFDLAVFVDGADISDIAKFVSEKLSIIDGIISVQTHFILKKYKIEGQITKKVIDNRRELFQA